MNRLFSFLLLFTICSTAICQVSFNATSDATEVLENSTFQVRFTLNNAEGTSFRPPNFKNFDVVSGPSSSTSYSNINGRVSNSRSYSYVLLAKTVGSHIIGPAEITIKGKPLQTKPLAITVLKSKQRKTKDSRRVFTDNDTYVKIVLSDSTAYIGQQIVLNYKLYTKQDVQSFDLLNEPKYEGFYTNPINQNRRATKREIVNGEEFFTKVLKSVALFPQQTGTYYIDPVVADVGVPIDGGGRGGFFFSRRLRKIRRVTNGVTIYVDKAPLPAPKSFSGGVGLYTLSSSINKRRITTDDAIVLNLEIRGDGDAKILQYPKQDFGPNLDIYDPNLLRDDSYPDQGKIVSYKAFEYLIVPTKPGNYLIKPEFTFFNADSNRYQTLYGKPESVNVIQGSRTITKDNRNVQNINDITDLILNPPSQFSVLNAFPSNTTYWLVLAIPFMGILGLLAYKFYLLQKPKISEEEKRRLLAQKSALAKLAMAKSLMDVQDKRGFYDEVSKSLIGYFGDKFHFPLAEMSKEKIHQKLVDENVSYVSSSGFLSLVKLCELFLYAGNETKEMQVVYREASELIIDLDLQLEVLRVNNT